MRNAFADEILKMAREDPRVVLLSGDIGNRMFDGFKDSCPDRFYNCGVAEAGMMSVAAGLATCGLRPFIYTITPFTTTRCFEQIRVGACYHRLPVVIVGTGSGLSYSSLGPTHHSLEDMAIMRSLPDMTVFAPCDSRELRGGLRRTLEQDTPTYIRIGKKGEPDLHAEAPDIRFGKSIPLKAGTGVCLIGAGVVMSVLLDAAARLEAEGVSTQVESFFTVKPLDVERLEAIFARYKVVGVAEEHGRIGGLYGAVSEWLADRPVTERARLLGFGAKDQFLHKIGSPEFARAEYGLTAEKISKDIAQAFAA
jgi:transketolase